MSTPTMAPAVSQLSCFTAALAGYAGVSDAAEPIARSIRLAVRDSGECLEFTHHRRSLAGLAGGTLGYASAPGIDAALVAVEAELRARGRVVVVANTAGLDWSPEYRGADGEAHWILVDDRDGDRWHLVDGFDALLPAGTHRPYAGWLSDVDFAGAIRPRHRPTAIGRNRDRYAFGTAVEPPPPAHYWWLRRDPATAPASRPDGAWATGDAALDLLCDRILTAGADAVDYLPDVWAAARHRLFQLDWQAARDGDAAPYATAAEAWKALPMALRFAVEAARRGRARPALLRVQFDAVATADATCPPVPEE
jgi:hypothetical protein